MIVEVEPVAVELNGTKVKIIYELRMTNSETGRIVTENFDVIGNYDRKTGKITIPLRRMESMKRRMKARITRLEQARVLMANSFMEESANVLQEGLNE